MTRKPPTPGPAADNPQNVWLAGLEALTRAQQQGSRMFDALVQEGVAMQRRAQSAAESRLAEAGGKVQELSQTFSQKASGPWDKLEGLFDERVARSLERMGYPTAAGMRELQSRVAELEARLSAATTAPAASASPVKSARKTATRKTAR